MVERLEHLLSSEVQIDDCWNRIGVRGDRSCARLAEHIHCHNCPVYAEAAVQLLDRYDLQGLTEGSDLLTAAEADADDSSSGTSVLVFRLGDEWLALPTVTLATVLPPLPMHSLPHRRSQAIEGIVNVDGSLLVSMSLPLLLELPRRSGARAALRPRLLVVGNEQGKVAFAVDEVLGVQRLTLNEDRTDKAVSPCTQAVVRWRQYSLRLLDSDALLRVVARNMT